MEGLGFKRPSANRNPDPLGGIATRQKNAPAGFCEYGGAIGVVSLKIRYAVAFCEGSQPMPRRDNPANDPRSCILGDTAVPVSLAAIAADANCGPL